MKRRIACLSAALAVLGGSLSGCSLSESDQQDDTSTEIDRFADIRVLRFEVPGFDELDVPKKQLAYYLYQATLSGRDIVWDQNYAHNLRVRRTLEAIVRHYSGDRAAEPFRRFMVYTKQVWFSNGIHHHVSNEKFQPDFRFSDLANFARSSSGAVFPLRDGQTLDELLEELRPIVFDLDIAPKKVNRAPDVDKIATSAVNFYADVPEAEVSAFYDGRRRVGDARPVMHGLNSKLVKGPDGHLVERVWKIDGMYGDAIERIVRWLERAITVAENEQQSAALELLVQYYRTGDLAAFDRYNIAWLRDIESTLDLINGFIEVYDDPLGFRGSYESILSFRNPEASVRIASIAREAQWFEDHSPIRDEHKRNSVQGVVGTALTVIAESGDASPSSPSGINLPNSDWIRANYGSKAINLTNIVEAHEAARGPELREFAASEAEITRGEKYDLLARNLLTDLHEVIGHASGRTADGIDASARTLKQYASTLEEARADLVALYFSLDPKLVEIGAVPNLEVGEVVYDSYIRSALLQQLHQVEPGFQLEEDHMRNRQLVAAWVFEMGRVDGVIERKRREGKTYFEIRDYAKLRTLFGELLRETQRIKSEGDFEAARELVETYGVYVDRSLHAEVIERYATLDVARFIGFVNPRLVAVRSGGNIVDVKIEYPSSFEAQMLEYADSYSFLPTDN